jgi:hypothetical protein
VPLTDICLALTYICMRTTLNLDDRIVEAAKRHATREGTTLTEVIDRALRQFLAQQRRGAAGQFRLELHTRNTPVLPGVDLEDRDALHDLLEDRR